jgi:hypothetical protein
MTTDDSPSEASDQDEPDLAMTSKGTLVIRTWYDSAQPPGFRARLTYSQDLDDEPVTVATADPDEVVIVVRNWLMTQPGVSKEV